MHAEIVNIIWYATVSNTQKRDPKQNFCPLLTLRDRYAHSLWSIFLCSYWWFCNWNSNTSNVRIVIVGAIIGTPVIIPGAAYRLKNQTKQHEKNKQQLIRLPKYKNKITNNTEVTKN